MKTEGEMAKQIMQNMVVFSASIREIVGFSRGLQLGFVLPLLWAGLALVL